MGHQLDPDIYTHYATGVEHDRLATSGLLEATRTREILARYLPTPPATVYDIGGAEGAYALPLAQAGYHVALLDPFAAHVEAARAGSAAQPDSPLDRAEIGDARTLPYSNSSADAILMLGPLYHLTDQADRLAALAEARRVLRPGGRLFAAAISRFASTVDGVRTGAIHEPAFENMVVHDLRDGVHRNPNPAARPDWFTLAYFHRPDDLAEEVTAAGFTDTELLAIEGVGVFVPDSVAALNEPTRKDALLRAIRRVEAEPSLLGASPHLMAVASA